MIKGLELLRASFPVLESLLIGNVSTCNLKCKYCGNPPNNSQKLSTKDIVELIEQIPTLKRIKFSGGEPTLDLKTVEEVIAYCSPKGIETQLNTNGTIISKKDIVRLRTLGLNVLHFSFNCLNSKQFKDLRGGAPCLYEKLKQNIINSVNAGFNVICETILNRATALRLLELHKKIYGFGVRAHELQIAKCKGRMNDNDLLPVEELTKTITNLILNKIDGMNIYIDCLNLELNNPHASKILGCLKNGVYLVPCIDSWRELYVHSNGDVLPCNIGPTPGKIGNVFDDNILDVFDYAKSLRSGSNRKCGSCSCFN